MIDLAGLTSSTVLVTWEIETSGWAVALGTEDNFPIPDTNKRNMLCIV